MMCPVARSEVRRCGCGLIDQVVVNLVPMVFGSGRPFFATGLLADPVLLENLLRSSRGTA